MWNLCQVFQKPTIKTASSSCSIRIFANSAILILSRQNYLIYDQGEHLKLIFCLISFTIYIDKLRNSLLKINLLIFMKSKLLLVPLVNFNKLWVFLVYFSKSLVVRFYDFIV